MYGLIVRNQRGDQVIRMLGLLLILLHTAVCDPIQDCPIPSVDELAGSETDFYECIENILDCGEDGYPLSFGVKYAGRFNNVARPRMDEKGKAWVDGTTICLQRELRDAISSESDCEEVNNIGFGTHNDCYIENGFCSLGFQNWIAAIGVLALEDALASFPDGLVILIRCLIDWLL